MPEKDTHTKKRVSKACDCCRKSKTKCDGQRPCTRCLQDGKICTYMTKKKAGQVYPASYVDLLETRVSVLVQTLTQLLDKSNDGPDELYSFCSDDDLRNETGDWDINKVISRLLPADRLQNLAESSETYSLHDMTDVTSSPSSTTATNTSTTHHAAPSRSPSPRASHTHSHSQLHSHHHLSKARRNSDNHIHKLSTSRPSNSSSTSSASSLQSRLGLSTHSPTSTDSSLSTPLDIFKPSRSTTLDSILSEDGPQIQSRPSLELDVNFSDTNTTSALMSPVYSIEEGVETVQGLHSLDSAFQDLFSKVQTGPSPLQQQQQQQQQQVSNALGVNMFGLDWEFDGEVKREPLQSFDF